MCLCEYKCLRGAVGATQKMKSEPLELELEEVVRHPMWVCKTKQEQEAFRE